MASPDPSTEALVARAQRVCDWADLHGDELEYRVRTEEDARIIDDALLAAWDVLVLAARLKEYEDTLEPLRTVSDAATPGPWWFDGRDIFTKDGTTGHHLVIPLPDTWHESQRVGRADAELIVAAVNVVRAALAAASSGETPE